LSVALGPKRGSTRTFGKAMGGSVLGGVNVTGSAGVDGAGLEVVPSGNVTTSTALKTVGSGNLGVAVMKVAAKIKWKVLTHASVQYRGRQSPGSKVIVCARLPLSTSSHH
jgi:hypothetical protein